MKQNRVILGIIVNGEPCHGSAAAALAAAIINNKLGHYVVCSVDVTSALDKTGGKATIYDCRVSYYYL